MKILNKIIEKYLPEFDVGNHNEQKRQEWLRKKLGDLPSGLRILDAGAGELQNKKHCNHLNYVSQDFCQYDGKGDSIGLQTQIWDTSKIDIVCDITQIPEPDKAFDVVLCSEVFEHLSDPVLALKELGRLVKNEGMLILTAPFCSLTHFAPYHFANGFNIYFYEKYLKELNFEIVEISRNGNYFEYLAQEIRRLDFVAKKYSTIKPANKIRRKINSIAEKILLNKLGTYSSFDVGSSELLCFGYFVMARKKDV